jgi:hypothetical protein
VLVVPSHERTGVHAPLHRWRRRIKVGFVLRASPALSSFFCFAQLHLLPQTVAVVSHGRRLLRPARRNSTSLLNSKGVGRLSGKQWLKSVPIEQCVSNNAVVVAVSAS